MVPNRLAYVGVVSKITGDLSPSLCARMTFTPYTRKGSRSGPPCALGKPSGVSSSCSPSLALLEGVEIIEKMVAHFFEIFGDALAGVFFLEFLDDAIDQYRCCLLLQVTQLAGQF